MATVTIDQPNRFGDELYRCRTRRRLSQLDLATRAGTTRRYVSYVERGPSAPGRAMVIRLAEPLELSLPELNEPRRLLGRQRSDPRHRPEPHRSGQAGLEVVGRR
jgi:transcriptional regulator with XRE-family HTH domain